MSNNIINHISDKASSVKFDPKGTDWPSNVKDVQTAIANIGTWANIDPALHEASETVRGIFRLSTEEERKEGQDHKTAITPLKLKNAINGTHVDEDVIGWARYATDTEAMSKTITNRVLTPKAIHHVFDTRVSSETIRGTIKISTTSQALAGTDDTTAMTPLKVKQIISKTAPRVDGATESVRGYVRISTPSMNLSGVARDSIAISPFSFRKAIEDLFRKTVFAFNGSEMDLKDGWVLCNGQTANGIRTPDLRNKFVFGGDFNSSGVEGGSNTKDTSGRFSLSGTSLSVEQMPDHNHSRGTMNITGQFAQDSSDTCEGAFYSSGSCSYNDVNINDPNGRDKLQFRTIYHTQGSLSYEGGGAPHYHRLTGGSTQDFRPPYYTLAYIMYVGL